MSIAAIGTGHLTNQLFIFGAKVRAEKILLSFFF